MTDAISTFYLPRTVLAINYIQGHIYDKYFLYKRAKNKPSSVFATLVVAMLKFHILKFQQMQLEE
jgi:hypothetical protein